MVKPSKARQGGFAFGCLSHKKGSSKQAQPDISMSSFRLLAQSCKRPEVWFFHGGWIQEVISALDSSQPYPYTLRWLEFRGIFGKHISLANL